MQDKDINLLEQGKLKIKAGWRQVQSLWQKTLQRFRRKDLSSPQAVIPKRVGQVETTTSPVRQTARKRIKPIRRRSRQRVYRLAGYTTVSKINSRRKSERRQRALRQLLLILLIILVVILLFRLYNPIKDLAEWYRIIGIKELKDLATSETTATTTTTSSGLGQTTTKITQGGSG
jgi:cell division protein FtsW (lipid II flippase)